MKKIKIGITGQSGFTGSHLYNFLCLQEVVQLVNFEKNYFDQPVKMHQFVAECDVIVHLAGMNRHNDPQIIYQTNISLAQKLITACEECEVNPHIIFSSTTQEERDNLYGKSKKEARFLLEKWGNRVGAKVTGLIIPNIFGPFGRPNYNSVVATFCHKLTHGEKAEIHVDSVVKLIYINQLVERIYSVITSGKTGKINIPHQYEVSVSKLLQCLKEFKASYFEKGIIPDISTPFKLDLFNTFRCYIPHDHFPFPYTQHTDNRGSFVEIARTQSSGQFSFSTTKPNITRGNHFHTRKAERFAVIKGKARIELRKFNTDKIITYEIDGNTPAFVDMPIWYTHNITNIGDEELITLFWINEAYNPEDSDTYFIQVRSEKAHIA